MQIDLYASIYSKQKLLDCAKHIKDEMSSSEAYPIWFSWRLPSFFLNFIYTYLVLHLRTHLPISVWPCLTKIGFCNRHLTWYQCVNVSVGDVDSQTASLQICEQSINFFFQKLILWIQILMQKMLLTSNLDK